MPWAPALEAEEVEDLLPTPRATWPYALPSAHPQPHPACWNTILTHAPTHSVLLWPPHNLWEERSRQTRPGRAISLEV